MALPTNLSAKLKAVAMDPIALASDLELAYTLSFAQHNVSHQSIYLYPRDLTQSPLQQYQFADFDSSTYEQLLQQAIKGYKTKNKQLVKGMRCGFKQFYARVAANTFSTAIKFVSKQKNAGEKKLTLAKEEEQQYRIQKLKANNPTKWPESTKQFVKELNNLPWFAFSTDSQYNFVEFVESAKNAMINLCHKAKIVEGKLQPVFKQNLLIEIQAFLGVILRTNNQTFILQHLKFISELHRYLQMDPENQADVCKRISAIFNSFFGLIPKQSALSYHYPESLWNKDPFVIMKKIHFQKYAGLCYYTIATDGNYLYIYVSAVNGGMFKIGTGNGNTKAGKVYLEKQIHFPIGTKVDEVSWVFLKGKLVLKTSSKDSWVLEVIDPETFKKEGNIQLFCPSLYGQQSLINLNKNSPLLTDGNSLYVLGVRLKICKNQQNEADNNQKQSKSPQKQGDDRKPDQKRKNIKKKPGKKNQQNENPPEDQKSQNYQKILEVVLYEFSIDGKKAYAYDGIDQKQIDQLYDSFSGYFSKEECVRALVLNNYDLAETCQWLFNQGEKQKEKNIKILDEIDHVIIAECQITSNFQEKAIKGPAEITTKEGSILNVLNIFQSIWTMDKQHITCYSQTGTKIFSRNRKDFKKNPQTKLSNTIVKVLQAKYPRNPEFNIIYDPYNFIFYTYTWPQDGHYFPTTVLVSNDKKHSPKQNIKKSLANFTYKLSSIKDVRKLVLWHIQSIDKGSVKNKYRFNDWLWYYGQRVIEVGTELNQADSDKKRLSNKRTKLLAKLNKINEVDKIYEKNKAQFANTNKVVRHIVKLYPFQSEGTIKNYVMLNEAFRNIQNLNEQVPLYISCLESWLSSSSSAHNPQVKNILNELGENLQKLKTICNQHSNLINKLLLKQFNLFFPTIEKQIRFITSLNQSQLLDFIKYQVEDQKKQKEEIVYELTKKQQLIQKYQTNKCDFADLFKSQSNVNLNQNKNSKNIANLLFNDIIQIQKEGIVAKQKINENSKKILVEYLQKQLLESQVGSKFIETLFLSALKILTNNSKNSANYYKYFTELFVQVFGIYEKVIPKHKTLQLFNLLPTFLFIVQIYHGSQISLHPNQAIINSLLHIAQSLQRPELNQIHTLIQDYQFEGISPITEKIYETSHPVQRGKNYNFAARTFHNASYLLLDLDRRCQSDSNNDTLSVQMIHQDSPVGNNIQVNDGVFNSNLRLSGTVETKKPYMIFGNAVSVDFNSSGHVKDTQSLVRYGFKFGLRPIFTGKLKLNDQKKQKLNKLFKNIQNFQNYLNTLKFTALTLSSTIENYLVYQNEVTEDRINNLLKGKIFKQGFEETAYKFDYSSFDPLETLHSFISKTEGETVDKQVLKKSQQKYFTLEAQKAEKKVLKQEELWSFEGIPVYIRNYLQQIKEFKGDFIDVFTEARQLAKEKGNYAVMMRKKAVQQLKTLWLQGEAILFLTILKHSGLLHLNLKFSIEYIKQNLKAFEDARDGIYNSFISRIQYANEWRNLIDTYIGKQQLQEEKKEQPKEPVKQEIKPPPIKTIAVKRKGPAKTVQIGTKITDKKQQQKPASKKQKVQQKPQRQTMQKVAFEKYVRERLSNQSLIKGICNIKNIKYDENFQYDTVTHIIEELIKASERPLQNQKKAYKDPIQHLIKGCLFLLKFKSPSTKQSLTGHEQIVPVNMSRSLSSDNRNNVDANKLKLFRQWLQNWKNWKGFKKQGRVQLQFPVEQIVKYINSWIDLEEIYKAIHKRYLKCQNRIQFYTYTQQLQKLLSQTKFVRYTLGSEILNIQNQHHSGLQSISQSKLKELQQRYNDFKDNIKAIQNSYFERLPLTLQSLQNVLKGGSNKFLEKIKLLGQALFLLQSENPQINLNLLLYFVSFKYLSTQNEDLVYLANSFIQKGFISHHTNENIVQVLIKQVGNNNVNFRRWKDYFFVERVLFLLRKLQLNLRGKTTVVCQTQQKIAESIFYLLYHIQIPLIARLGLKILRRLNISLKQGIRTPFDYQYKLYKENLNNQLELKQQFRLPRNNKNNITLLCSKINNIFDEKYANELASKFEEVKEKAQNQIKYNVILNLHQEEDLYWLIKVLYYIDELDKKNGQKVILEIKDFQEYLQMKNRKREGEKKQQQNANEGQKEKNPFKEQQKHQRIFNNLPKYPKISPELQKELPVGWYFNYCNIFADPLQKSNLSGMSKSMKNITNNPANIQNAIKNAKNKNQNNNNNQNPNQRKNWNTPIFSKLYKKYEEFNSKPPQQPKQGDSAELKAQFVKARNYFIRIRKYFAQIIVMMDQFSRNGYYLFREDITKVKMNQICQLITTGSTNRLKDIDIDLKNNDIKVRLQVNDFAPNFNSKLKITIIKAADFPYFDNLVSYQSALSNRPDNTHNIYFSLLGKKQLSLEDAKSFMPYEEFIPLDQSAQDQDIQFGKQWIESNFSRMKKKHQKVYLNDYPNDTFYIGQGGIESGIKDNILIPANDSSLTLQTSTYEKILSQPKVKNGQDYEQTELPQELIEKINKILQKGSIQITKKSDIKQYLLLTFYLKKLKKFDLQFVDRSVSKQFAQKLFKFSQNLKSYKELEAYQEDIQKLIVKLIDNQHQKLHLFGTYIHDDDYHSDVEEYLIPMKLQKLNSSNEVKQESIQTHSYIKSKYLLKSQPPQMEQNKLLKYWEKNILPRILDFVKTTLKPIQIEDFWQQMRRPLRVGDHTEAKRVAYIICDNKLPAGAVLPDANHNWNSLQIEQIFVGEDVLVKVPRSKSDFSTPLLGWGNNDQKLAKIVFVDLKNNSVLVRYRLEQLAIFSYTWVPINSLMGVQKEVMHISTKSIYEEINKKLEGVIYIYAKECLTKLASSVSDGDNIKLIKETILDLFIKNPISGCFNFPKPVWSMRPIFEKMLEEGNFAILDSLQKHFSSIKGIDLNLNTQKMLQLNRFDDAKALIVSFKKDSKLAVCSGVRFYNDKFGYNEVAHVYTAKTEKADIQPLEFNEPNIYCKYYTNKQCLPIVQQNNYKVYPIQATIFAVDEMWTIGCYLGEVLCEIASAKNSVNYLDILKRFNTILLKWLCKKSVSILCSHLSKLVSKISLTIGNICQKNNKQVTLEGLGTNLDQLKDMIAWSATLLTEETNQKVALYSALLQNLSQMIASLLVKTNVSLPNLPQHIKSSADLIKMFKEIDNFTKTKKMSLIMPSSQANYQWQRILEISNIPSYFNQQTVYNKIKQIVQLNKGKILCPKLDIFQKNSVCYVLVDGWDVNELVQEEIIEKMEQQIEEERQEQINQSSLLMEWECPACTYKNPSDVNTCQICETAAPVAAKQQQVYDVVEATDLKAAERKIKERQAKRFEEVKIQILKFFEDQFKVVCDLVQKRNQELEEQIKKDGRKNKKEYDLDDLKQIPKKPEIKLETGSSVFQKENIDEFLKVRFQYFPAQLKKLVETEQTFIGKFKKLLNCGYDLWGDSITNQNATLIPFNYLYLLMDYIQTEICKGSSSVLSYSEQSIRILSAIPILDHPFQIEPVNYIAQNDIGVRAKYKVLASFKSYNTRYSWKLVKELNLAASKCLQFINMDLKFDKERNDTCPVYNDSLGYKTKYFRNLIMGVIKLQLFQKIIQKTSVPRENDEIPKIFLERLKIKEGKNRTGLLTVKQKQDHLFTKSHDQFLKISHAFLRPFKPKGADPYLSFTVTFKGENVQGEAGPYRQFFTDIARELEPRNLLGLFIPSPNNRNQSGQFKSRWVINPKANSSYHFSLFEFIGTLMGCCFRTGSHLALDLPSMFWKSITHEQITDADLDEVDNQLLSFIKILKECPSKQAFQNAMELTNDGNLTWVYRGYDDQVHEMIYDGKNASVQFEDIDKYIEMLKLKKINETKLQVKRIVQGLSQLIPLPYLHCLTGEELKLSICGRPKVDVDLLKKHTKYSGGLNQQSRRIKYFWQIMRELPETERLKIIRFCWGQQRLPINSEQFERNNIRFMIKPMVAKNKNEDQALPRADTCFFNIELPDYSTKAIMREKILLAVNLDSVSINADEMNNDENPLMNEIDTYGQEDYQEGGQEW